MGHKPDKMVSYQAQYSAANYIHDYDIDVTKREIYLFGREEYTYGEPLAGEEEPGVDWMMANRFIRNIRLLASMNSDPIIIHMKTCGGDFTEGMAIYDAIRACPAHVTIINYAAARSMSSIILQAAEHRVMTQHSWFMMHQGTEYYSGTQKSSRSWMDFAKRYHDPIMCDVYSKRMIDAPHWSGKTKKQIIRWIEKGMNDREEVYLMPSEAVKLGLADAVFGAEGDYDWESLRVE